MMVKERRLIVDLSDITSLIYTCRHCEQEIVCKLDGEYAPGASCANCSQALAAPSKQGIHPARTLLTNLRHVLKLSDSQVRVQFVMPDQE